MAASRTVVQRLSRQFLVPVAIIRDDRGEGDDSRDAQQLAASRDFDPAVTVAEKPVVTDAHEAVRQHVEQEAADELVCIQCHFFRLIVVTVIFPAESHLAVFNVEQAIIRNGYAMGVASQVVKHLLSPGERAFGVNDPFGLAKRPQVLGKITTAAERLQSRKELQMAGIEGRSKILQE